MAILQIPSLGSNEGKGAMNSFETELTIRHIDVTRYVFPGAPPSIPEQRIARRHFLQPGLQFLAISAAHFEPGGIAQHHLIFSARIEAHILYARKVHDGGAMNPTEAAALQV